MIAALWLDFTTYAALKQSQSARQDDAVGAAQQAEWSL